jgi:CxxH/CxxC protein (TIGR04129 family)
LIDFYTGWGNLMEKRIFIHTRDNDVVRNEGDAMYVVCEAHIEMALDDFVDEFEMAPDVYRLADVSFTGWQSPSHCEYCGRQPVYLIV